MYSEAFLSVKHGSEFAEVIKILVELKAHVLRKIAVKTVETTFPVPSYLVIYCLGDAAALYLHPFKLLTLFCVGNDSSLYNLIKHLSK